MQPETVSRIIFWVLFAVALGIFANRALFLYRLIRVGQPDSRFDSLGKRLGVMLWNIFPQRCSLKSLRAGAILAISRMRCQIFTQHVSN